MSVRNSLVVLLFGGALGLFLAREQQRGTLEPLDRVHREFLKANPATGQRTPAPQEPAAVLVRLDDVDQPNRVFGAWPLADSDWQIVLQNLAGYGPRATALAAPLPFDAAGSGLAAAAAGVPGLCVPVPVSAAAEGSAPLPASLRPLKVTGSIARIPEFKSARAPAVPGTPAIGPIDLLPRAQGLSVEGDWCRVPLLARKGERVYATLVLGALLQWANIPAEDVTVLPGVAITAGKDLRIEIDEAGFFRYFISLAPPVPAVNGDVFVLSREQAVASLPPGDPQRKVLAGLHRSLLWIGHDDEAARLLRLPNGSPVSPAELTARAIAAIQTSSYMRPLPPSRQWIAPAATLLFCLWLAHWRRRRLWAGAAFAVFVLAGVSLHLYHRDYWWMPLGPSFGLLAATVVLAVLLPRTKRVPELEPPAPPSVRTSAAAAEKAGSSPSAAARARAHAQSVPTRAIEGNDGKNEKNGKSEKNGVDEPAAGEGAQAATAAKSGRKVRRKRRS